MAEIRLEPIRNRKDRRRAERYGNSLFGLGLLPKEGLPRHFRYQGYAMYYNREGTVRVSCACSCCGDSFTGVFNLDAPWDEVVDYMQAITRTHVCLPDELVILEEHSPALA